MLMDLRELIDEFHLRIKGVIHIGAHEAEEYDVYIENGISPENQCWIEALPDKVRSIRERFPDLCVINAVLSNVKDASVIFHVTNNFQSSSILPLKDHLIEHPHIHVVDTITMKTDTLSHVFEEYGLERTRYNFMNIDVQGAELLVLQGMDDLINGIDYIYTEVNERELYEGCVLLDTLDAFLHSKGFSRVKMIMLHHGWGDALYIRI